jgi:hypothetical protein
MTRVGRVGLREVSVSHHEKGKDMDKKPTTKKPATKKK